VRRTFVVLVWFHITLATFLAIITTMSFCLSKLCLKYCWFLFSGHGVVVNAIFHQCVRSLDNHSAVKTYAFLSEGQINCCQCHLRLYIKLCSWTFNFQDNHFQLFLWPLEKWGRKCPGLLKRHGNWEPHSMVFTYLADSFYRLHICINVFFCLMNSIVFCLYCG